MYWSDYCKYSMYSFHFTAYWQKKELTTVLQSKQDTTTVSHESFKYLFVYIKWRDSTCPQHESDCLFIIYWTICLNLIAFFGIYFRFSTLVYYNSISTLFLFSFSLISVYHVTPARVWQTKWAFEGQVTLSYQISLISFRILWSSLQGLVKVKWTLQIFGTLTLTGIAIIYFHC